VTIALDGHATGGSSAITTTTVTLTTTNANDIIIVQAVGVNASSAITVSSVTASGLTFSKRKSLVFNTNDTLEVWYATASSVLSSTVITVNWSSSVTAANVASVCAFGVSGVASSIWDTNVSLPATNTGSNSIPTVTGVSTSTASTMLLGFSAELTSLTETAGTGYTLIDSKTQGAVTAADEYQVVSSTQSSISVAFGTTTTASWSMIADALVAQTPFAQVDWPIPVRFQVAVDYREYSSRGLLQTTLAPVYQLREPIYTLRIQPTWDQFWSQSLVLDLVVVKPFNQQSWPLPYPVQWYQTWSQSLVLTFPFGKPFNQLDWPLTTKAQWDQFWAQNLLQNTLQPIASPFIQTDWPNPTSIRWYQDWAQNLVLTHPSGKPFAQIDWPLPSRLEYYRDWNQNLLSILSTIRPFKQSDWPLPFPVRWFQDWFQALVLRLPAPPPPVTPVGGGRQIDEEEVINARSHWKRGYEQLIRHNAAVELAKHRWK